MAAIDFPASPTDGQQFSAPNGITYVFSATPAPGYWKAGGGVSIAVGVTPPASPYPNQLWWNSELGLLFIWYNDGNSTQWVPIMPGASAPQGWRLIQRVVPTAGQAQVDLINIPSDINDLMFHADVTPTAGGMNLILQFFDGAGVIDNASGHYPWVAKHSHHAMAAAATVQAYSSTAAAYTSGIILNANIPTFLVTTGIRSKGYIGNIRDSARPKTADFNSVFLDQTATYWMSEDGVGTRNVNGAITGLRFIWGSTTFAAGGAISLWGSP